jgi:hypothetical protein
MLSHLETIQAIVDNWGRVTEIYIPHSRSACVFYLVRGRTWLVAQPGGFAGQRLEMPFEYLDNSSEEYAYYNLTEFQ